jgi:cell division protein FtsB
MYADTIRKAFSELPTNLVDQEKIVENIVKNVLESVVDKVQFQISDYLIENIKGDVCQKAAEIAEHMLRDALAGDDKELRNLFNFNDWYMQYSMPLSVNLPKQWKLIDAIVKRHPQFFVDERIKQYEKHVESLKANIQRLEKHIDELRERR